MLLVLVIKKSLSLCKQITVDKTSVGLRNTVTHSSTGIKDMYIIYRHPDEIYRTEMHNTTNGTSYQKITNSRTVIIVKKTKQLLTLNKVNHGKTTAKQGCWCWCPHTAEAQQYCADKSSNLCLLSASPLPKAENRHPGGDKHTECQYIQNS